MPKRLNKLHRKRPAESSLIGSTKKSSNMENIAQTSEDNNTKWILPFLNNQTEFNDDEEEDTLNGLCFVDKRIPEEILLHILSHIDPKEILKCTLVCRKWNKLIKSYSLWATIYSRKYNKNPKKLPWYLYYCLLSTNYFDTNLLQNGNGQDQFDHWELQESDDDGWIIEDLPDGSDPLPEGIPEFNNKTSCFATSFFTSKKTQAVRLGRNKLFKYILDCYKPHIYLSEWTAGRFDCGCKYKLGCEFGGDLLGNIYKKPRIEHHLKQGEGLQWKKIEMTIMDYPEGVQTITFEHEGHDTHGMGGHYGSKMAGGVIKLLFDSIDKLPVDEDGHEIPKPYIQIDFVTNAIIVREEPRNWYMEKWRYPYCHCHIQPCIHRGGRWW